jgi:hypothetical protein
MRNVLERAQIGLGARRAAANHQNRGPGERGVGDPRDRVGHTRTGRHHRGAQFPRKLSVSVRHVNRRDFMANIDDANAKLRGMVPNGLDVPTLQTENAIDAARL